MHDASSIDEIQAFVREQPRVIVRGGGTKPALCRDASLDVSSLAAVVEYEPSEYTFTALAGTPIREVEAMLAEHGQYLPFDPPLVEAGATLGGTVATGLSGPGRFRYGGVRDFLLGVRLVNGEGELIRGGGKVVKNAAGFDIPKLMIGSLGQFGVIVELTFKVFPAREASCTYTVELEDMDATVNVMTRLATSNSELDCLEIEPPRTLRIRISGMRDALPGRTERLRSLLPEQSALHQVEDDWSVVREFRWVPADHGLVKIPLTPQQIATVESQLRKLAVPVPHRYSGGGQMVWIAWPKTLAEPQFTSLLESIQRPALAISGDWSRALFDRSAGKAFADRLRQVFDPRGKFQRPVVAD